MRVNPALQERPWDGPCAISQPDVRFSCMETDLRLEVLCKTYTYSTLRIGHQDTWALSERRSRDRQSKDVAGSSSSVCVLRRAAMEGDMKDGCSTHTESR